MKTLVRVLCLASLVVVSAFGQRGGMHGGGFGGMRGGGFGMRGGFGPGFHGGFGHGFRGGFGPGFHGGFGHGFRGFAPGFRFGVGPRPFFFHRSPFFAPGFRSPFFRPGFGFGFGFGAPFGGFWGAPVYPYPAYGGFDYNNDAGAYPYTPTPNVTVIYPPSTASDYYESGDTAATSAQPEETSPSVVINEYRWGSSSNVGAPQKTVYFSIAMLDNSVVDASAYWVDGDTLHYIDRQGKEKQVPVSQVNEARSQQLNRERGIEFGLPKSG